MALAATVMIGGCGTEGGSTGGSQKGIAMLRAEFVHPEGEDVRPWTFWYWMFGAVSEEGIRADLEAMKRVGLGGAYLMPIKSASEWPQYGGRAEQLSDEWWRMVRVSMETADSLGLELGMHICDGFALAGGPWITPAESMQKVVSAEMTAEGGRLIEDMPLPQPQTVENYYEDIALLAVPAKSDGLTPMPRITRRNLDPTAGEKERIKLDTAGVTRAQAHCEIIYEYDRPVECRYVEIVPDGNNYQAHRLLVEASDDGVHYRRIKQLEPARHGWQNTGFNSTHAVPPVTARWFRFTWRPEGSEPGAEDLDAAKWRPRLAVREIRIGSEPRLNQWEGKAGLVWRVARATGEDELAAADCTRIDEVIDLTDSMHDGRLTATLPEGRWRIVRMGHTSTGHTNATGGGGRGLECDKFSEAAVGKQFDNWFGRIFDEVGPELAHRVLKVMHVDSWECGSQNWSATFADEFRTRRGYDLRPWLPLLAGVPMESAAESERVLRDVRLTIAELVDGVFYKVLAAKAKEYGCRFSAECVAPTMVSDGLLHYRRVDLPMGEFWLNSPTHDKPNDMLDAISGAHIYGKNIIQAEAFTELRGTWDESPATIKTLLDRNYALGINKIVFHVDVHNPYMDRRPGMTLDGIGLFFQRDNTWYSTGGRGLTEYMRRCQSLLQYGRPVADIAVYAGDELPRRALLPDRLVGSLPGLFGEERVESERQRLENEGQPLRTMPVKVVHSANMADPDKWVDALRGYAYDTFNNDALAGATMKNGRLTLAGGATYAALVVPLAHPMNPECVLSEESAARIETLKAAGCVVPQLPWREDDLSSLGIERDAVVPAGTAWCHRRSDKEDTDIYFIANQTDSTRTFTASLRIDGRRPEVWNPMTGRVDTQPEWRRTGGRTEVVLTLAAGESVFVVFARKCREESGTAVQTVVTEQPTGIAEWHVKFVETGVELRRSELFDWSQEADERVRYYSGTAIYTGEFDAAAAADGNERIVLKLGELHDVAAVRVNGRECGVVWTAPYETDITAALTDGRNTLEIEVANTWANALQGAAEGKAPFGGIWTNAPYRRADKSLLKAGLLGPVAVERRSVKQ